MNEKRNNGLSLEGLETELRQMPQPAIPAELENKLLADIPAAKGRPRVWYRTRLAQAAVAGLIVIGTVGLFSWLTTGNGASGVALAEVLESIRTSSYTFDLTVITKEQASTSARAMVLEPGRMRFEVSSGLGRISAIVDMTKGKSLLLFQKQKAGIMETPTKGRYAEVGGFLSLCMKPIENLWNLRDGTEAKLGKKEIDSEPAAGFKVLQKDQHFQYEITIWADTNRRVPILVEMIQTSLDDAAESLKFTMHNFSLDRDLGEELFSVEIPPGYTLAYESDLDQLKTDTGRSPEAEKIEELLRLWSQDRKSEALEMLLGIHWTEKFTFSEKPYIFTITEKQYISLKHEDQQQAMRQIVATVTAVRSIGQKAVKLGVAAMSVQDYEKSERYFDAGLQFGKLLMRDPDSMLIVRLTGIAAERDALSEMVKLYTVTSDPEKLRAVKEELQAMQDEQERIKTSVSGR